MDVVGVSLVVLPVAVVGAPLVVTAEASEHWLPSSAVVVAAPADSWELQQGRHGFALVSCEADGSHELRQAAVLCVRGVGSSFACNQAAARTRCSAQPVLHQRSQGPP